MPSTGGRSRNCGRPTAVAIVATKSAASRRAPVLRLHLVVLRRRRAIGHGEMHQRRRHQEIHDRRHETAGKTQ